MKLFIIATVIIGAIATSQAQAATYCGRLVNDDGLFQVVDGKFDPNFDNSEVVRTFVADSDLVSGACVCVTGTELNPGHPGLYLGKVTIKRSKGKCN